MQRLVNGRQSSALVRTFVKRGQQQQIQPFCRISSNEYLEKRQAYKNQLTDLRKQWTADFQAEQDRKEEEKRIEIENTVLRKAIRLREKRAESARRNEIKKISDEKTRLAYREHLARLSVRSAQKNEVRKQRFHKLQEHLVAESKYWLTPENYREKITEDLFKKPCTTGVVDKSSEMWRHYIKPFSLNRVLQQIWEDPDEGDNDSLKTRLEKRAHKTTMRQDGVRHLINGMIGTGHDRERYSEFVEEFSSWHERTEGSERTQHLAKYADEANIPEFADMTKQEIIDLVGDPLDGFTNQQLKAELDNILEDGQRVRDLSPDSAGSASSAGDLFPMDDGDDEDSDDAGSDSDDEKEWGALGGGDASPRKKGVARAAHVEGRRAAQREQDLRELEDEEEEADEKEDPWTLEGDDDDDDEDALDPQGGEMFASAESSSLDELIEDLAFVDEQDEAALKALYQKIRLRAAHQQSH